MFGRVFHIEILVVDQVEMGLFENRVVIVMRWINRWGVILFSAQEQWLSAGENGQGDIEAEDDVFIGEPGWTG